jgi:hypothetical protein
MVNRAFDKIRQAGGRMPAVVIRLLDAISHVAEYAAEGSQRAALLRQADMILRGAEEAGLEENDLSDIVGRYEHLLGVLAQPSASEGAAAGGHGGHDEGGEASEEEAVSARSDGRGTLDPLSARLPSDR